MVWILMNVRHVDKVVHTSFFDRNWLLVRSTCRKKLNIFNFFRHVWQKDEQNRSTCCQKRQHVERQHSTCCRCGRGFNESRDDGLTVARSVAIEFHFQIRSTREDWKQHTHGQITKTWTIIMPTLVHNTAQNTDCRPRKVFESGGSNWGDDERGRLPPLQGRRPCWGWIRKAGCPSNNGDSGVLPPENCGNYMCIMGHFVLHDAENRMIVSSFVWTKHRYVAEGRTDVQTELL